MTWLDLYREGGLSLVVVVGLAAACLLLYRDLHRARVALVQSERRRVREAVSIAIRLGDVRRHLLGSTDPPPASLLDSTDRDNPARLAERSDRAWEMIETHLATIGARRP